MEEVHIKKIKEYDLEVIKDFVRLSFKKSNLSIKSGFRVLVKPNFLLAKEKDSSVITNPVVIRAVLEVLIEYKAIPFIYEIPSVGSIETASRTCGLDKIAKNLGVEIVKPREFVFITNQDNLHFKRLPVPKEVEDADLIINLAKVKTHSLMGLTLGVKNVFGLVKPEYRSQMHFNTGRNNDRFGDMLIDVYNIIEPSFTIIDGIVGMEGNGPANGNPKKFGFMASSSNAFALDTAIILMLGLNPTDIPIHRAAQKRRIVGSKEEDVSVIGDKVDISQPIVLPDTFRKSSKKIINKLLVASYPVLRRLVESRPKIEYSTCISCFNCMKICPAKAITKKGGKPHINYKKCIKCFCCHEVCPKNSISIQKSYLGKVIEKRVNKKEAK